MYKNLLNITLRNLFKNKTYSAINLLGLAIGLASTILISLWIFREWSVDNFHENRNRLYRVLENQTYSGSEIFTFAATPGPLAEKLKEEFPEITHASRVTWSNQSLVSFGDQSYYEEGLSVDEDFLEMFSFPVLQGDVRTMLDAPNNILITRRLAEKYFGGAVQAMGQTLKLDDQEDYTVTGILENVPENSSIDFDFLLPLDNHIKDNQWLTTWESNGIKTYLMTQQQLDPARLSARIRDVVRNNGEQDNVDLHAQAMPDWYLRSDWKEGIYTGGGRIENLRLFSIIALFILFIACINFMNLSTAKSATRAIEVGIRKVSGATRSVLATQFLGESVILSLIAGALALVMANLMLPYFNEIFNLEISFQSAAPGFWIGLAVIILFTGILAGSYPALYLSGFRPVNVLKGVMHPGGGAANLRKVLVVTQFLISTFLIISTFIVYQQMELIREKQLGYDKENLLYFRANEELRQKYETVKNELLQLPGVKNVSYTTGWIHSWGSNTSGFSWPGKDPEQSILFQTVPAGYDFIRTIGASIKEGRDFSKEFPGDSTSFIVNETAVSLMGLEDPIGQILSHGDRQGKIIGVVKDFHVGSFRSKQDPLIMLLAPYKYWIYMRFEPGMLNESLAQTEAILKKHNPAYPFEYHFTDQEYEALHRSDQQLGALSQVFAFLAIFVSCLGLFGLATFSTEQRRREIGIRKVLGASVINLLSLLSKDFLRLVMVAILLATPLAWWVMSNWLQDFAFHIELKWWLFAAAGLLAILIAFVTVSFQSTKAALANPVQSLRNE